MSSSSNLEVEDLQNFPLVRMEDVQPSKKGRKVDEDDEISVLSEVSQESQSTAEIIETSVVDGSEFDCLIDDDDSYIGSMVSIKSEDTELIVPDILEKEKDSLTQDVESPSITPLPSIQTVKTNTSGSWPTLEILPGGVINLTDRVKPLKEKTDKPKTESLFACAKCQQQFNYLFSLVKHVKTHEDEEKQNKVKKLMVEVEVPSNQNKSKTKIPVNEKRSIKLKEKIVAVTRAKPQRGRKGRKPKVQVLQDSKYSYICLDGSKQKVKSLRELRLYGDKPLVKVLKKKS